VSSLGVSGVGLAALAFLIHPLVGVDEDVCSLSSRNPKEKHMVHGRGVVVNFVWWLGVCREQYHTWSWMGSRIPSRILLCWGPTRLFFAVV